MKNLFLAFALFFSACGYHYSSGARVGKPYKLSLKGFVNKTWEGEMVLGGPK